MAMYEDQGFCPNNSFLHYEAQECIFGPDNWKRTRELLGDRMAYMVYTDAGCAYKGWSYVVDCLMGAESTIGIEIACVLQVMIPKCEYAKTGRKILVTDVINPYQIPFIGQSYINSTEKFVSANDSMHIFEDGRYVCGVIDEGENGVHLYFYKK